MSVSEGNISEQKELWTRRGQLYGKEWHSVRIPVRADGSLNQLHLKAVVPPKNFLAVSEIRLTNAYGHEMSCGKLS